MRQGRIAQSQPRCGSVDRRAFLAQCAGAAALSGVASRAFADDPALDALMDDGRRRPVRPGFRPGLAHHPYAEADGADACRRRPRSSPTRRSRPTTRSSPAAAGRRCLMSMSCGSATAIRAWSICGNGFRLSGDLDPNAVGAANDIYDSYVEAAMRRFQARHGVTIDGVLRPSTLAALNVPAAIRRDQLKVNIARLKTLTTNLGPRYVVVNIPAARVEAIENDVAVSRHTAVAGKPIGRRRTSTRRSCRSISIRIGPCRSRSCAKI